MPKTTTVTCDACGADLATATGQKYRLVLQSELVPMPPMRQWMTLQHAINPMPEPAYFCGLACLAKWAEGEKPPAPHKVDAATVEWLKRMNPGDDNA